MSLKISNMQVCSCESPLIVKSDSAVARIRNGIVDFSDGGTQVGGRVEIDDTRVGISVIKYNGSQTVVCSRIQIAKGRRYL